MISNIGRKQKDWFNDAEFENLLKIHQNKSGWIYGWNKIIIKIIRIG